ncbi:peptidase S7 [Natronospora cellulosivora (SeqCode)]
MPLIKGIAKEIVDRLEKRSVNLGQGRNVGVIAFIDEDKYISKYAKIVDGGLSGLPYRKLLATVVGCNSGSLLELINLLPENAVIISTIPGKTGIITSTGGINIFDKAIIKVGIKNKKAVAAGILYPETKLFNLASHSEKMQLKNLAAKTMDEEKESLREISKLHLKYLEISSSLDIVDIPAENIENIYKDKFKKLNHIRIQSSKRKNILAIDKVFAEELVGKSNRVEQGREVAAIGLVNENGIVERAGEIVVGGLGYVPSRLLASSYKDISEYSLRKAYTDIIPENAVIVHTHPGGTGVMHMGDAMAGPGTWGRAIIAIGHNKDGEIKGATVIRYKDKLAELANEYEDIDQDFFKAETTAEEAAIRKRRYEIAQEFTDLCEEIEIRE